MVIPDENGKFRTRRAAASDSPAESRGGEAGGVSIPPNSILFDLPGRMMHGTRIQPIGHSRKRRLEKLANRFYSEACEILEPPALTGQP
jgi:hypothetical protein